MTAVPPSAPEFGEALPVSPAPQVLAFLARRRSVAAVTLGEPAPSDGQLRDLLGLAARAPDHGKLAPWRFIVMGGADKAAFAARLERLSQDREDPALAAKLAKLKAPPLAVFVVSAPKPAAIPEWEQVLSAGVVCANLLYGALAMGFGANWITDWYSYDAEAGAILGLGLGSGERVAGCILIGTPREPPLERERPDIAPLVTRWTA